ncbi:hypothetical protein ACFOW1_02715 [Parasediminibacterium paludis]|uniref:Cytochrome c domain-containing protein n=1 Tax=Parasediminibacterium paludis TaxID=908966 RepID=A0ABV8PVU2_9BACT
MRRFTMIALAIITVCIWAGCTYKKEVTDMATLPIVTCDTTNVRYSVEIVGILSANCYSCHAAPASFGGGNILSTYNNLKPYANSNLLYHVVNQTPGYDPMPKGAAKLVSCDIAKIRTWIRNGAPNN